MQDKLISFETAKLAREKSFNEEFESYYDYKGELLTDIYFESLQPTKLSVWYSAPTQSFLQKWLREVHNYVISIKIYTNCKYYYELVWIKEGIAHSQSDYVGYFSTYEEALEAALIDVLNLI